MYTSASLRCITVFLCVLALTAAGGRSAASHNTNTWPVKGKLVGPEGKKSQDVSGIACATLRGFPRSCLVIDDNAQGAQFVTVREGAIEAGDVIPLIHNTYQGKPLELDGERIAYAEGAYYVIGSHGHPRARDHKLDPSKDAAEIKARIAASSQLIRIRIAPPPAEPTIERTDKLRALIAGEPVLQPFVDRRLEQNGVTIEGVAVRHGCLLAGFRGPVLHNGHAVVLSVALGGLFDGSPPDPRLYRLPLGAQQGIRDLAPFDDGLLVLAGPAAEGPGVYAIYWWDGESEQVQLLTTLTKAIGKKGKRKAEAILPLEQTPSGIRVLLFFDGEPEGAPLAVEIRKSPRS